MTRQFNHAELFFLMGIALRLSLNLKAGETRWQSRVGGRLLMLISAKIYQLPSPSRFVMITNIELLQNKMALLKAFIHLKSRALIDIEFG